MWYSITTSFGNPSFTKQSKVNPLSKLSSAVLMQRLEIRISARDKKGRNHLQAKTGIVSDLPEVKPCLLTASQLLPSKIKQNPSPKLLPESCNYLENRIVSVAPRPITGKGASIYTAGPCRSLRCPLSPRPQRSFRKKAGSLVWLPWSLRGAGLLLLMFPAPSDSRLLPLCSSRHEELPPAAWWSEAQPIVVTFPEPTSATQSRY